MPRKVDGTVDDERYDSMNLAVRFDDCFALGVLTAERDLRLGEILNEEVAIRYNGRAALFVTPSNDDEWRRSQPLSSRGGGSDIFRSFL